MAQEASFDDARLIQLPEPTDDLNELRAMEKAGTLHPLKSAPKAAKSAAPQIADDFVVFGYVQSEGIVPHLRWHALTHVGTIFIDFNSSGAFTNASSFTGRSSFLKAGGAAEAAGVKVLATVRNAGFNQATLDTVMQSASLRETLADNIASLVMSDAYCHGVNLDFEPSWGTTTRDGITQFLIYLRTVLPSPYEITLYTHPIYSSTYWNIPAIEPHIDWMNYSAYPWAGSWSTTTRAITDADSFLPQVQSYMNAGLPPEKMVLTLGTYGRVWTTNTPGYGATIHADGFSIGFTDGLHDTTLSTQNSGPHTNNYVTGDETGWYSFNDGNNRTAVWEDPRAMEYKLRQALSHTSSGKRLRGVGFWSLMWLAETSSINPLTGGSVSRTRTYPHA